MLLLNFVLEYLSEIISFFALLISAYATYQSLKFKKNEKELVEVQKKLNQLLLKKEEKEASQEGRASLGANFITVGKHKYRLKIFNKGSGPAFNVQISFPDGNDVVSEYSIKQRFPLEKMDRGQSLDLLSSFASQEKRKLRVKLKWENEDGGKQENLLYPTL